MVQCTVNRNHAIDPVILFWKLFMSISTIRIKLR